MEFNEKEKNILNNLKNAKRGEIDEMLKDKENLSVFNSFIKDENMDFLKENLEDVNIKNLDHKGILKLYNDLKFSYNKSWITVIDSTIIGEFTDKLFSERGNISENADNEKILSSENIENALNHAEHYLDKNDYSSYSTSFYELIHYSSAYKEKENNKSINQNINAAQKTGFVQDGSQTSQNSNDNIKSEQTVPPSPQSEHENEIAKKAGYVQGVCECVAAIFGDSDMGKKLLYEMNVTKDMSKKYANPETFKTLEQSIFTPKPEQKLEQQQSIRRGM